MDTNRIAISIQPVTIHPTEPTIWCVELVYVNEWTEQEIVVGSATASTEAEARELAWEDARKAHPTLGLRKDARGMSYLTPEAQRRSDEYRAAGGRSYDEVAQEVGDLSQWLEEAERALRKHRPGTESGRKLYQAIRAAEEKLSVVRRECVNHPDAPPRG